MYDTIETILKQKGITIYRLAKLTGINESTLKNWKYRGGYLSFINLCRVADVLEIDVNEFRK